MPTELVEVVPHSTEPEPIETLRKTLKMLPASPELTERDGRWYVPAGFAAWACEKQGYVKQVLGGTS